MTLVRGEKNEKTQIWCWQTNKSFGVFLQSGSFNRQLSTNDSATLGYRPSGISSLGAGLFTICCNSSKITIVIPPSCKLTPLLFHLAFCVLFFRRGADGRPERENGPWSSWRQFPFIIGVFFIRGWVWELKSTRASSMSEILNDHTSNLTEWNEQLNTGRVRAWWWRRSRLAASQPQAGEPTHVHPEASRSHRSWTWHF